MKKLLTIAIPTYNGGENLLRAVKSCNNINLNSNEYEILVVDNCSTDESIEKVRDLAKEFDNIKIIRNEKNIGRISNWNRCLELAQGEYLIFLFSNDELLEFDYKSTIEYMSKNNIDFCYSKYLKQNKDGTLLIERNFFKGKIKINYEKFILDFLEKFSFPFAPIQANIYRLENVRKHKIKFIENFELNGDQLFTIDYLFNSKKDFLMVDDYYYKWNYTSSRFHYKFYFEEVFEEDIRLLEFLIKKHNIELNKEKIRCYFILRTFLGVIGSDWKFRTNRYMYLLKQVLKNYNPYCLKLYSFKFFEKVRSWIKK